MQGLIDMISIKNALSLFQINDYRPVALTIIIMKCCEKIVLSHLQSEVKSSLDSYQFVYRSNRSVEDATLTLTHHLYEHIDTLGSYARLLMVDFSSAFNMCHPGTYSYG